MPQNRDDKHGVKLEYLPDPISIDDQTSANVEMNILNDRGHDIFDVELLSDTEDPDIRIESTTATDWDKSAFRWHVHKIGKMVHKNRRQLYSSCSKTSIHTILGSGVNGYLSFRVDEHNPQSYDEREVRITVDYP